MKQGCGLTIAPWLVGGGFASHIAVMNQIRAALKRLERMVFAQPDARRRLRLVASHNEIRGHDTPRVTRKHLILVSTGRAAE